MILIQLKISAATTYTIVLGLCIIHMIHIIDNYTFLSNNGMTLSLLNIFLGIAGVFYGILAFIIMKAMGKYIVGKLFSLQLFLISTAILLNTYAEEKKFFVICFLFILSNILLFYLVARITQLFQSKLFKGLFCILLTATFILIFFIQTDYLLFTHYFITCFIILSYLKLSYGTASFYTKKQIKAFTKMLTIGISLYSLLFFVTEIEVSTISPYPRNTLLEITSYQVDTTSNNLSVPAVFFSFITYYVFNHLMKQEYLRETNFFFMKKITKHIIYFVFVNFLIILFVSNTVFEVYLLNLFLFIPFLRHERKSEKNKELSTIFEKEKQRLANYLHDEILQEVLVLKNRMTLDKKTEENMICLIKKIRNASHELYPLIVEKLGLNDSLQLYFDEIDEKYKIQLSYIYDCPAGTLPSHLQIITYRVVKELTINSLKHADCTEVFIYIYEENNHLMIKISDNGKGFDVSDLSKFVKKKSIGLISIYKQIEGLDGEFQLQSRINDGTTCLLRIPIS